MFIEDDAPGRHNVHGMLLTRRIVEVRALDAPTVP